VIQAEKGMKPVPVPPPAWRPALAASAACVAAAALFLLVPARAAFGGADLSLGAVPGFVKKLEKKTRALARTERPEDLAAALALLDRSIADLDKRAGAATLAQLRDELLAKKRTLATATEAALVQRVSDLVARKRLGAALELADPTSASLVALDLAAKTTVLRAPVLEALRARNEVYVPEGPYRTGPRAEPAASLPGFYIDRTEVTNKAWSEAMAKASLERPPSWPEGPLPHALELVPVTDVTWEKAARGLDGRAWPWGERFLPGRANLLDGGSGALEDVSAHQGDVSPFGVLGLAGNALEWVQGAQGPLVAGGGFRSHALSARVFTRFALVELRHPAVGFRCARDRD
jgi:formylglycine-generating enzyme required for sulfatase activity